MIEKLGQDFDNDVLQWKSDVEKTCKKVIIAEAMKDVEIQESMTKHVSPSIEEKFGDGIFDQEILSAVLDDVSKRNGNEETNEEIYATLLEMYRLQRASGFQITDDNVDLAIKARHMSTYKQNQSIHWFNLNAVKNRVHGNHLPEKMETKSITDIENILSFLPSF